MTGPLTGVAVGVLVWVTLHSFCPTLVIWLLWLCKPRASAELTRAWPLLSPVRRTRSWCLIRRAARRPPAYRWSSPCCAHSAAVSQPALPRSETQPKCGEPTNASGFSVPLCRRSKQRSVALCAPACATLAQNDLTSPPRPLTSPPRYHQSTHRLCHACRRIQCYGSASGHHPLAEGPHRQAAGTV